MSDEKHCPRCCTFKALEDFGNNKNTNDGKARYCKPCKREYYNEWAEANPEKVREKSRRYDNANLDKIREYQRKYRESNKQPSSYIRARRVLDRATKNQQSLLKALDPEKMAELKRKLEQMNQR